ncbi:MAG: hypothetical protein E2593_12170 [Stenotrophomonas sp.]|nr:hypothetical protein [Stenotrophomonas sp.]
MTVPVYTGPNTSIANGVTTVFPYNFRVLQASHLLVTVNGQVRQLGVHYTVDGVGNPAGGNITFMDPPANNAKVVRQRAMPFLRLTDYQNLGDLLADTLNEDQDSPVMMIQQLAAGAMLVGLDPESGDFVWDAKGNRIVRVGDAVAEADALNLRSALVLIEQIQGGGGTTGVTPKAWSWEGDGESTDFPLVDADVFDPLFYDTALEATSGAADYLVVKPDAYTIVPATADAPPVIRFPAPPAEGIRGFTVLRGYARPWIGQTPIYTVAPNIITNITGDTILDASFHNTLIVIGSADDVTLTIRANTGGETDWKRGQFFSTLQLGTGKVRIAIEAGGELLPPDSFANETRARGSVISATCYAPDSDSWVSSGDLLRSNATPSRAVIELIDRSALSTTDITTGSKDTYVLPFGLILDAVIDGGAYGSVMTPQASGTPLQVNVRRNGTSIFSTRPTFDNGERSTRTAATPAVYAAGGSVLYAGDEIDLDVSQVGTAGARGLRFYLVGQRAS